MNCTYQDTIKNITGIVIVNPEYSYAVIPAYGQSEVWTDYSVVNNLISQGRAVWLPLSNIEAANTAGSWTKEILSNEALRTGKETVGINASVGSAETAVLSTMRIEGATEAFLTDSTGLWGNFTSNNAGFSITPLKCSVALKNPLPRTFTAVSTNLPFVTVNLEFGEFSDVRSWFHCSVRGDEGYLTTEPVIPFLKSFSGNNVTIGIMDMTGHEVSVSWDILPQFELNNLTHVSSDTFRVTDTSFREIGLCWEGSWSGLWCFRSLHSAL